MYCGKCGKPITTSGRYCPYCSGDTKRMKKKKKWPLLLIPVGILLVAAVILGILYFSQEPPLSKEAAQAELNGVLETVFTGADPDNLLVETLEKRVRIQVLSVEAEDDSVTVQCEVKAPDLKACILAFSKDYSHTRLEYDALMEEFRALLQDAETEKREFSVPFVEIDGKYVPIVPEEMVIFCSGGVQELLDEPERFLPGGEER